MQVLPTLWRQNCVLCTDDAKNAALCPTCRSDLPNMPDSLCPICALPVSEPGVLCGSCLKHPPAYERTLAAYAYNFPLDRLVHAFKYHHQFSLLDTLTAPLVEALQHHPRPDALLPMPLHPWRLRERGYNQALLLAQHLARQLKLPLLTHSCQRTRATAEQARLSREQRLENLRGAFACDVTVQGLHIAIVDDVMTSGSSVQHLAQSLKQAGARTVECWVVARALQIR
uniref:Gluconate periplasmic binding protein with phosphoribosyltransferase domain, GNT I system n=1 Tax=mine drainage metagenome TaxID=410659 RepID=E6QRD4_9ZZZZ